jgi:hypothetical protein
MFHSLKSKYNHGFTFLEIIAIIAIIIICSVLFKVIHNYRSYDIKSNVAQEELALNCAIEMFKSDNGFYPTCTSPMASSNAKELYGKLSAKINSLQNLGKHPLPIPPRKAIVQHLVWPILSAHLSTSAHFATRTLFHLSLFDHLLSVSLVISKSTALFFRTLLL